MYIKKDFKIETHCISFKYVSLTKNSFKMKWEKIDKITYSMYKNTN